MTDAAPSDPTPAVAPREHGTGTGLLRAIGGPVVWAGHFLVCYVVAAIHCAKAGRDAGLEPATLTVGIATLVALALIVWNGHAMWRGYRRSVTDNDFDFEYDSAEERHRFLGHMTLMLCALSAVGVLFVAIPAVYLGSCR